MITVRYYYRMCPKRHIGQQECMFRVWLLFGFIPLFSRQVEIQS